MQLPSNTDISGAFSIIDDELAQVKALITEQLALSSPFVRRLLESFNLCSGKMLRPGIVLLAGKCCGKITDMHIRVAAVIEMIHNATLLHDDVIDNGQQRRRTPTINSIEGNESAVLLGDFLLSQVFCMCSDLEPYIIKKIAETTMKTCNGELMQITQRRNWQLSEAEYIDIISQKSAALFAGCGYLGACLAGAEKSEIEMLEKFGHNSGIAFQITDDLLDIIGDESKTGKTAGNDIDRNKLTLGMIHLLTVVDSKQKENLIDKLNTAARSREEITEMLNSHGSLEYVRSRTQDFTTKAIEALKNLKETAAKQALIETAGFVANRVL